MEYFPFYCFDNDEFDDQGYGSDTSSEQLSTEDKVIAEYKRIQTNINDLTRMPLRRTEHLEWLVNAVRRLPNGAVGFNPQQPWVIFWAVHSMDLLDPSTPGQSKYFTQELCSGLIDHLFRLQCPGGGFTGDFGCEPHVLTTYAAVMSLITLGARINKLSDTLSRIDKDGLYKFYTSMKLPSDHSSYGAFRVCPESEYDTRAVYGIVAVCYALDMISDPNNNNSNNILFSNTYQWLLSCQTWEGGFGAEPCNEAHGGYAFCAIASLHMLGYGNYCNLGALERWALTKQMSREGGFCGRTHKLVDSCYSFWISGILPIISDIRNNRSPLQLSISSSSAKSSTISTSMNDTNTNTLTYEQLHSSLSISIPEQRWGWGYDQGALQLYILAIAQEYPRHGFRDKPFVTCDVYHTCYSLSGLSLSQIMPDNNIQHALPVLHPTPQHPTLRSLDTDGNTTFNYTKSNNNNNMAGMPPNRANLPANLKSFFGTDTIDTNNIEQQHPGIPAQDGWQDEFITSYTEFNPYLIGGMSNLINFTEPLLNITYPVNEILKQYKYTQRHKEQNNDEIS